jgi:hypothetical protein
MEEPAVDTTLLVNVTPEGEEPWDWHRISTMPPPAQPEYTHEYETATRAVLDAYKPSLLDRVSGAAKQKRAELTQAVIQAATADVLLDAAACRSALQIAMAYRGISGLRAVNLEAINDGVAMLACMIDDPDRMPDHSCARSSSTNVLAEAMPAPLSPDHVCSLAIRIARETFAVLPIASVAVNLMTEQLEPNTGQLVPDTILAIRFSLEALTSLTHRGHAPAAFPRVVKSTVTPGVQPIEALTVDSPWSDVTPLEWDDETRRLRRQN